MTHLDIVKLIVGDSPGVRTCHLHPESQLLGGMPELDSMAVTAVIARRCKTTSVSPSTMTISAPAAAPRSAA